MGGYTLMHTADLRRVAPKWVSFSEDVRADPDVRSLLGFLHATLGLCAELSGSSGAADSCWSWGSTDGLLRSCAMHGMLCQACLCGLGHRLRLACVQLVSTVLLCTKATLSIAPNCTNLFPAGGCMLTQAPD